MTHDDFSLIVKRTSFFKDLEEREIDSLLQIAVIKNYQPSQVIFNRGDPGIGLYV
jgi:CRP-like cAMP-binding protein